MLYRGPTLDAAELRVIAEIDDLRERLRIHLHEPRRWVGSLRRHTFARNLQASNSIEGIDATLDDADAIAMREEPLAADAPTRDALAGYRDAMTYVLRLAADADFDHTVGLLRALHFMLVSHDLGARPGQWRTGAVYVRSAADNTIVYTGPDVDQVPPLMRELVAELTADDGQPGATRLVAAAMAHLNLVRIHPFRDGNGRMARILQSLVIARSGVLSPEFVSIEEYLGHHTDAYYAALAGTGDTYQPGTDTTAWLRFVLTAHHVQANTLLRRISESEWIWTQIEELATRAGLPERHLHALFDSANGRLVRPGVYRAVLEANSMMVGPQTVARDMGAMVRAGLLVATGAGRGRAYRPGPEIARVRTIVLDRRGQAPDRNPFA